MWPLGSAQDTVHIFHPLLTVLALPGMFFLHLHLKTSHLSKARVVVFLQLSGVLKGLLCGSVHA